MVGGAHCILGPFGQDPDLRRHGQKIAERGGKSAKKRAVVAVARKLPVFYTTCGFRAKHMSRFTTPGAREAGLLEKRPHTTSKEGW